MPKLSFRLGVWIAVGLLTVVVLSGSVYLLTYKHPEPQAAVEHPDTLNMARETERAKTLPEYAELKKLFTKENRPLTPAAVARAGELVGHSNYFIRVMAIAILGNAKDALRNNAAALVAPRLKDNNLLVRASAMDALARLHAKDYIPELTAFLSSEDTDERACAKRALETIGRAGH